MDEGPGCEEECVLEVPGCEEKCVLEGPEG